MFDVFEGFVGSPGLIWRKSQIQEISKYIRSWIGPTVSGARTSKEWVDDGSDYSVLNIQLGNARHPELVKIYLSTVPFSSKSYATVTDSYTSYDPEVVYKVDFPLEELTTNKDEDGFLQAYSPVFLSHGKNTAMVRRIGRSMDFDSALPTWRRLASFLKERMSEWDSKNYVSRNVADFKDLPFVHDLLDMFEVPNYTSLGDWTVEPDTSMVKNRSEYTLRFSHASNAKENFSVRIKALGGDRYSYYVNLYGNAPEERSTPREYHSSDQVLNSLRSKATRTQYSGESRMLKRKHLRKVDELKATNPSTIGIYSGKELDRAVNAIGDALGDAKLRRSCIIDIRPLRNGQESWSIEIKNTNANIHVICLIDETGNIVESEVRTLKGNPIDVSEAPHARFTSRSFIQWLGALTDQFLDENGAYNKSSASIDSKGNYVDPDYDLNNWVDRQLVKIEDLLRDLTRDYDIDLDIVRDEVNFSKGNIILEGDYRSSVDNRRHSLEVRINWTVGNKFKVWIRPDMKGSASLKSSDRETKLTYLADWVKDNVKWRLDLGYESYRIEFVD